MTARSFLVCWTLLTPALLVPALRAQDDILIADFEADDYGAWRVEGEAFGPGPARGTLPGQMEVSGYAGSGLVNTYFRGDGTTGTLTSPTFIVERRFLKFLIGGGGFEDETCVRLVADGEVVRSATGDNTEPGGSEELVAHCWDLQDLLGRRVTFRIVDAATGGWGHLNVDHIVLSNLPPTVPNRPGPSSRECQLTGRYLLFPVRTGARKVRIDLGIAGRDVREFDIELAPSVAEVDFWSFLDIGRFRGQTATLRGKGATDEGFASITQADELPAVDELYDEALRPQLHFSQRLGWNNDPNGLVHHDGEWHLYFQHNPYGWSWGNMHWGHAVSTDLVHWQQLPIAIYNRRRGDWAYSGGAVVDEHDTAGWQTGDEKVIVASFTSTGRGECLAYSDDRGRTFSEFEGNPVVRHDGRDPKIVWYEPGQHWVMAVYDRHEDEATIAFHTSPDLRTWTLQSRLPGYYECPELLELPLDGDRSDTRWVVFAADARYAVGSFDGKTFTPEHEGKHRVHHGAYYASQVFSNSPDGRRIQIGWARIAMPGMAFNQTFGFPLRLTLRTTPDGIRMFATPVRELETLRRTRWVIEDRRLTEARPANLEVSGELLEVRAVFEVGSAQALGLDIGGNRVTYDATGKELDGAPLGALDGRISLQVLVDRPMLEVCGNDGRVFITGPREVRGVVSVVRAFAAGGEARLLRLEVYELASIWEDRR